MNELPIDSILPELNQALSQYKNVILSAQPGAGKTTRVPLALLDAPWLRNNDGSYKKIILLEPRRLAARNAALFMAKSLNESVGKRVGYRMRQDTQVSQETRIEVITEGILTRYLLQDPELSNIGLIIFDEHHERSMNTDLGLALSLQCQDLFRDDLKLLVMSATLDKQPLEKLLNAKTLFCPGRSFPVDYHYLGFDPKKRLTDQVTHATLQALQEYDGSLLIFLPGVRDIQHVQRQLQEVLSTLSQSKPSHPPHTYANISLHPLYGQLSDQDQQRAIQPAPSGQRKIVLATNIAESSLTIEGIRIVIDCGLEKQLTYTARSGMNALITKKISQASAVQRAGRAGRLAPGVCYRLWSEQEQNALEAHSPAEISRIELSDLVLNVAQWGAEVTELDWLTPPPQHYVTQAQNLLSDLALLDQHGQITRHGEYASKLGLHPRFAHMLLSAAGTPNLNDACLLAALLTDTPKTLRNHDDLQRALSQLRGAIKQYTAQARQAAAWKKHAEHYQVTSQTKAYSLAQLLALAFPDRIAKRRNNSDNQYLLSSGRGAELHQSSSLIGTTWLVVSDIEDNQQGGSLIRKAMEISEYEILEVFNTQIKIRSHIDWNAKGQLVAEERHCYGAIILSHKKLTDLSDDQWQQSWLNYLKDNGISSLNWSDECLQLKARLQLAFQYHQGLDKDTTWPDFSEEALTHTLDSWLLPIVAPCRSQKALKNINLKQALLNHLGWHKVQTFEKLVPERIQVPSGAHCKIDYTQSPPVLAIKLQEMFGFQGKPSVCNGHVLLMLHLLSPARKPLQITQDLPHFWRNSYFEVRKDMRGRYPKHPWPEDPMNSIATRFTKRKSDL